MAQFHLAFILTAFISSAFAADLGPYYPHKPPPKEPPPPFACAFENPLLFGASNSAGYNIIYDGLYARGWMPSGYKPRDLNPVALMQMKFFGKSDEMNISEIDKFRSTNVSEVSASSMPHHGYGYEQIQALLATDEGKAKFKNSSALVSFDAFYWQAADNKCEQAIKDVDSIIKLARDNDKPLILATVPEESNEISGLIKAVGKTPDPKCAQRINAKLKDPDHGCVRSRHCHLLDLHVTIRQLNGNGIVFQGKTNRTPQFRPDGVHLTKKGKEYIESLISTSMYKQLPPCARPAPPPSQSEVDDAYVVR